MPGKVESSTPGGRAIDYVRAAITEIRGNQIDGEERRELIEAVAELHDVCRDATGFRLESSELRSIAARIRDARLDAGLVVVGAGDGKVAEGKTEDRRSGPLGFTRARKPDH